MKTLLEERIAEGIKKVIPELGDTLIDRMTENVLDAVNTVCPSCQNQERPCQCENDE